MKNLISTILSSGLVISLLCASGQSLQYPGSAIRLKHLNDISRYRKIIRFNSSLSDSLYIQEPDSLVAVYVKAAAEEKIKDAAGSVTGRVGNELSSQFEIPRGLFSVSPLNEFELTRAASEFLNHTSFNHFSGQAEKLNLALSQFDNLKRSEKVLRSTRDSLNSKRFSFRQVHFLINCGLVRPLTVLPAIDLYPSIAVLLYNKLAFHLGKTARLGQSQGIFSGKRIAAEYYLHGGLSVFVEGEILNFITEDISVQNSHLITGIKKTILLKGHLTSFVMAGLDWGRQLPDDGYAERYRYRAGIEYHFGLKQTSVFSR